MCNLMTVNTTESTNNQPKERIHRGWMLLLLFLGVLVTAAAFPTERLWSWIPEGKISVVQSILISFGVALVSAGVLLLFGV